MASPDSLPAESLLPALAITPISAHTYTAQFPQHFCIGSVPHGGYITSIFLSVASTHFNSTLATQKQPDTFILSLNFLRRTQVGPALFQVKDVKLGRQTSIIHITLYQGGKGWTPQDGAEKAVEEVSGYITHTNFSSETGPSIGTGWSLTPSIIPSTFQPGTPGPGKEWTQVIDFPFLGFRKATSHIDLWIPTPEQRKHLPQGRVDQWVRMRSGEKWTNTHLGYLSDYFPLLIDFLEPAKTQPESNDGASASASASTSRVAANWYPTLVLNLDIKRRLPAEGSEWLNISAQMRSVRNGRSDIELVIFDTQGRLVAVSHHVCLVVPASRNTGLRREERVNRIGAAGGGNGDGRESKM